MRWGWPAEAVLVAATALVGIGGSVLAAAHESGVRGLDVFGFLLLAAGPAIMAVRRRFPVAAYGGVLVATLAYTLLNYPGGPIWLPLIVTLGSAVVDGHRVLIYASIPLGYVGFVFVPGWLGWQALPSATSAIGIAAWLLLLVVASELVRFRRAYRSEAQRRRLEMERSQAEEARRQASEERLAIARELHDVLAHSISLINVQAGVALELMDARPEHARSSLVAIKQASKDALVEVQAMLGTLRDESASRAPAAGLARLDDLAERARATGLAVEITTTGRPRAVPAGVDLATYRIVQEALTNVVRHAKAREVTVRIVHADNEITVEITDDGVGPVATRGHPGGNGLPGMRERAATLGGELTAGAKADGGFRVYARLPLAPTAAEAAQ